MPQILDEETNLRTLARLVEHFERHVEHPMLLEPEWGAPVARGTVGIRLPITHFQCKVKMSQDKDPQSQVQVLAALRAPGPYHHLTLADDMERAMAAEAAADRVTRRRRAARVLKRAGARLIALNRLDA